MLYGLDGASWQGYPNWQRLWDVGHRFMLWKITGEGNYVNPTAQLNLQRAAAVGFVTGGYDWVEPQSGMTGEDAARDYLRVCDALGVWRKGFLLGVDFETPDWFKGPLGRNIEPFMRPYVFTLLDHLDIEFYTGPYFLDETGARDWAWLKNPRIHFWEAAPGNGMLPDDADWPGGYPPFGAPDFHQHQWYATDQGVAGNFDRDRYKYDLAKLWALGWQGTPQPTPEVGEVQEPPAGKWFSYINDKGETLTVLNHGGATKRIISTVIGNVGVTVESETEAGVPLDHTFRDEQSLEWHDRRQDPGATQQPLSGGKLIGKQEG